MAPVLRKRNVPQPSIAMQSTTKTSKQDKSSSSPELSPQSSNTTTINHTPTGIKRLPVDSLLSIFGRIPLQDLLSLRRVSRIWNTSIIDICARKKRLTLAPFSPPAALGKSQFDLFWIDDLNHYLVDQTENPHESLNLTDRKGSSQPLIPMFANVKFRTTLTHLRLRILHGASSHNFIHTLCDLFPTLKAVQLKISSRLSYNAYNTVFDDKWIEPLSALKHLSELRLHDFTISVFEFMSMGSLPLVKKLTLCNRHLNVTNGNKFCLMLAAQFPNLDELVLVCRPFVGQMDEDTRAREAMQLVGQHFAHLRKIVCDFTAPEWSE